MSDPPRLLDVGADAFERELLSSAQLDRGSDAARRRALSALAASVPAPADGGSSAPAGPAGTALSSTQWIGIGLVVGAIGLGAIAPLLLPRAGAPEHVGSAAGDAPRAKPQQARQPAAVESPVVGSATESPVVGSATDSPVAVRAPARERGTKRAERDSTSALRATGTPDEPGAPSAVARARADDGPDQPAAEAAPEAGGLAAEVRVLTSARTALSRGDAATALAELAAYRRGFPQGTLELEAAVLHVEALIAAGQIRRAHALGERFLAQHPRGAHAATIERALRAAPIP